jgi:hypothetical protein
MSVRATGASGGAGFQSDVRGGKLKNWKSEKLTSRPTPQPSRIPDFQDFRFSPITDTPEILPTGPGEVGVGIVLNVGFMQNRTFRCRLY